jgi:hypothetical protein
MSGGAGEIRTPDTWFRNSEGCSDLELKAFDYIFSVKQLRKIGVD